jgi:hypothetical protein
MDEHSCNSTQMSLAVAIPYLTKSRYLASLQCGRRLWRLAYDPPPYEPPAPGSSFDVGAQVGRTPVCYFWGALPFPPSLGNTRRLSLRRRC